MHMNIHDYKIAKAFKEINLTKEQEVCGDKVSNAWFIKAIM